MRIPEISEYVDFIKSEHKLNELKEICKYYGIKCSGTKPEFEDTHSYAFDSIALHQTNSANDSPEVYYYAFQNERTCIQRPDNLCEQY